MHWVLRLLLGTWRSTLDAGRRYPGILDLPLDIFLAFNLAADLAFVDPSGQIELGAVWQFDGSGIDRLAGMIPLFLDVFEQDECPLDCGAFAHGVVGLVVTYSCAESFS